MSAIGLACKRALRSTPTLISVLALLPRIAQAPRLPAAASPALASHVQLSQRRAAGQATKSRSRPSCPGCGARFQHTDPEGAGYQPPVRSQTRPSIHARIASRLKDQGPLNAATEIPDGVEHINPGQLRKLLKARKEAKKLGQRVPDTDTPIADVEAAAAERRICRRCHALLHHSEEPTRRFPDPTRSFAELLLTPTGIVVNVLDATDLPGSLVPELRKMVGNDKRVILAVNKIDAMPAGWDPSTLEDYVDNAARKAGVQVDDVVLVSASTKEGIPELAAAVKEQMASLRARGEDPSIWFVGRTNVGKSRLLNTLVDVAVRRFGGGPFEALSTIAPLPGTTVDLVRTPLERYGTLFNVDEDPAAGAATSAAETPRGKAKSSPALVDTPGLPHPTNLLNLLTLSECRSVAPKRALSPRGYIVQEGKTLFIGGVARLDCVEGEIEADVYASRNVTTHRTDSERAAELYERHLGGLLVPPVPAGEVPSERDDEAGAESAIDRKLPEDDPRLAAFPPLKPALTLDVPAGPKSAAGTDVVLSGLGWVTLRSRNGATIKVWSAGGGGVGVREGVVRGGVGEVVLPSGRRKRRDTR
ncbi:P-loop containing nucleoside triphosphate hydrolase protein [Hyaloraphidium curvatum]|nr:P-loop containing nucleoside triphosphate hydrolase protein [Hyaloraphidium curvatum]